MPDWRDSLHPVFVLTPVDVAEMDDEEFRELWSVLGKIARRRARREGPDAL